MNAMTHALTEAGVELPSVKYRIWNWLRDHPEKTTEDIKKALGLNYPPYAELVSMEKHSLVKSYGDVLRNKTFNGNPIKIKRYSVTNTKEYIQPERKAYVRKKATKQRKVTVVDVSRAPTVQAALAPKPVPEKATLTEAEQFAAYLEFKALMKEMGK